jgi:hypothetical protein
MRQDTSPAVRGQEQDGSKDAFVRPRSEPDVVTHEYFHILGLGDNSVINTDQASTNANTIPEVVGRCTIGSGRRRAGDTAPSFAVKQATHLRGRNQ